MKDALKLLGQAGDTIPIDDTVFPEQKKIEDNNGELQHAVSTLQRLHNIVPLPQGCEVTRRLYIDPILLASDRIAGGILIQVLKKPRFSTTAGCLSKEGTFQLAP